MHINIRDEQFWFTLTCLGINGSLYEKGGGGAYTIWASLIVSAFAFYLILTRWRFHAGRYSTKLKSPEPARDSSFGRLSYTLKEFVASVASIFHIVAEGSGSLFYLVIIGGSFLAVCRKSTFLNWGWVIGVFIVLLVFCICMRTLCECLPDVTPEKGIEKIKEEIKDLKKILADASSRIQALEEEILT
ncbi:MAG: hypothetical protein V4507_06070 [Verrucomicrobiota bacterium]